MKLFRIGLLTAAVASLVWACSDGDDASPANGRLNVYLSDAPFPYELIDQANVTVYKVEARRAGEADSTAADSTSSKRFITLMEEEIQVNLLELTNGVTEQLASAEVPAGQYDLVRIHVKGISVVMTDSTQYDLKVPSGMQTGIKVFIRPSLVVAGGLSTDLLLDVDVSKSFVAKGGPKAPNGFNFKPVIRASNLTTAGTLAGMVTTVDSTGATLPLEGAEIAVMAADTVLTSTFSDAEGGYAIMGLEGGTYEVSSSLEGYQPAMAEGVVIVPGNRTLQDFELLPEE